MVAPDLLLHGHAMLEPGNWRFQGGNHSQLSDILVVRKRYLDFFLDFSVLLLYVFAPFGLVFSVLK